MQEEKKARSPQQSYESRRNELRAQAESIGRRSATISLFRGLSFLASLALVIGAWTAILPKPAFWLAGLCGLAFIALVVAHAILITREDSIQKRLSLIVAALDRIEGKAPPETQKEIQKVRPAPPNHPYAKDLDIFGKASLFSRLDTTQTEPGESMLAAWLSEPAAPEQVAERQEAVRELSKLFSFREDLAFEGLLENTKDRPVLSLINWAEGKPVFEGAANAGAENAPALPKQSLARIAMIFVPITIVLFTLSQALDWHSLFPASRGLALLLKNAWLLSLIVQLLLFAPLRAGIEPLLNAAASEQARFGRFHSLFARIEAGAEGQPFEAPKLVALQRAIGGSTGNEASAAMRSLSSIVEYAALRNNGFVHLFANTVLLWDLFCAQALERWRARSGRHARGWFASLGELEALCALGTYSFERPDHNFPELVHGAPRFCAEGLGHPLIPASRRVENNISLSAREASESPDQEREQLGPAGAALLITGSNMSGKSTLMRSMGVAAVMAQAGAPVCAAKLSMTPLCVRTSMRIDDSLERGISHFYAEVERLCAIVKDVDAGLRIFFLLDEILHGTNSRERHIGAKAVVMYMIEKGSIGSVSSHDLALADMSALSLGRIRNVHFEESIHEGRMAFDYKLKEGVVTTTNALRLMRLVGLNLPGLGESPE